MPKATIKNKFLPSALGYHPIFNRLSHQHAALSFLFIIGFSDHLSHIFSSSLSSRVKSPLHPPLVASAPPS